MFDFPSLVPGQNLPLFTVGLCLWVLYNGKHVETAWVATPTLRWNTDMYHIGYNIDLICLNINIPNVTTLVCNYGSKPLFFALLKKYYRSSFLNHTHRDYINTLNQRELYFNFKLLHQV